MATSQKWSLGVDHLPRPHFLDLRNVAEVRISGEEPVELLGPILGKTYLLEVEEMDLGKNHGHG